MRAYTVVSTLGFTLLICFTLAQQEPIRQDSRAWHELFDPLFSQPSEIPLQSKLYRLRSSSGLVVADLVSR
jgi:hypothetical protein